MRRTPKLKKKEYTVRFILFQSEKYLGELNTLRNSLSEILKNHKVDISTTSQSHNNGFIIYLNVLLKETKYLGRAQHVEYMGRFLGYVEGLIGDRLTTEPQLYDTNSDTPSLHQK